MEKNSLFEQLLEKIPQEIKDQIDFNFEVSNRIYDILQSQNKTQKELANLLGKRESEISKWLSGSHNFTISTIKKIERALNESIIEVAKQKEEIKPLISLNNPILIKSTHLATFGKTNVRPLYPLETFAERCYK